MYEPQRHTNYKNKIICKQYGMFRSLSSQCHCHVPEWNLHVTFSIIFTNISKRIR